MEHLFDPQPAEIMKIPYKCREVYQGGDFETYDARSGWSVAKLRGNDFQSKTEDEATGFLQSWLYFGLLWEFFSMQDSFDLEDFIRVENGVRIISTVHLPRYILQWAKRESGNSSDALETDFLRTKSRLSLVQNIASDFGPGIALGNYQRPRWKLPEDISLSIQILADTLQHAGWHIYKRKYSIVWGSSPLLRCQMHQNGWCPRAIATSSYGQQIHILCYASTLKPPAVGRDHRNCHEHACLWEKIDNDTYETEHRPHCSGCGDFIGPDEDELTSIYNNGETPLFRIDAKGRRWQTTGADGLGNQKLNKLPFCQLKAIQAMVDGLPRPKTDPPLIIFWWCDTLCIPVGTKNKNFRRKAIEDMRWTYHNAAKTLILDAELMCASVHDPPIELFIRLKLSSWARRLWTYQESNLSRDAYIQFSDGVMRLDDFYLAVQRDGERNSRSLYTRYTMIANSLLPPLIFSEEREKLQKPNFYPIWRQLEWRGTSRQTDEAVCLATLMRQEANTILKIDDKDVARRMAKFFALIRIIHLSLVFQSPPRIPLLGFKWAPLSLLTCFRAEKPLDSTRFVDSIGTVDYKHEYGLLLEQNHAVQLHTALNGCFKWSDIGCLFKISHSSIKPSTLLKGCYTMTYAFREDWENAVKTASTRSGPPVMILLLPAARDGTIACILAEAISQDPCNPDYFAIDFVGIAKINSSNESKERYTPATEILPRKWLLR